MLKADLLLFAFVALLGLAGCESFQSTEPAAPSPSGLTGVLDDSLTVGRVSPAFVALGAGDAATVNLTLRDAAGGPLPGRVIALVSDRATDVIWPSSSVSDANGVVTFSIASGSVTATVAASSGVVSSQLSYKDLSGSRQTNPARDSSQNRLQVAFVPPASAPASVSVVVGTPNPVTAGSPFPTITVGVKDNDGRPAAHGSYRVSVSLSPETGGSAVRSAQVSLVCSPGQCTTNVGSNVLSTTRAGTYRIRGTSPPLTFGEATITVTAAAADHLSVVQQTQGGPAGEVWSVPHIVQVVDQFENPTGSGSESVTLSAFSVSDCSVGVSLFGTISSNLSDGRVTFSGLSYSIMTDSLYLRASTSAVGVGTTPCSGPITVGSARAASSLGWVGPIGGAPSGGTAKAMVPFLNQPKVQVLDQYGRSFPSPAITPSLAAYSNLSSCNASSGPSYSLSPVTGTDGNGRFQFSGVQIASAGSFYFKATSGTMSSSCYGPVEVRAAPTPRSLVFSSPVPFPSTAAAGATLSFGVGAIDQYNEAFTTRPCENFSVAAQAYSDAGCSVNASASPSTSTTLSPTDSSGVYPISVTYNKAESIYLKATCTTQVGTPPVITTLTQCSPLITVAPGLATRLRFSPQPSPSVTAGQFFNAVVQVQDDFGNLVTSGPASTANISLVLSGGVTGTPLLGPTSMNASGGVAGFTGLSVRKANPSPLPSYTLTASSTVTGLTPATFSFNVRSSDASQFRVTGVPSPSPTIGSSFQVLIAAQDSYDNPVTTYAGTVSLSSSDPGAILSEPCIAAGGVCTFSRMMSFSSPGAQTLTLSDGDRISQLISVTVVDRCAAGGPYVGGSRVFEDPRTYSWAPFGDLSFTHPSPSPSMCPQVQVRLWGAGGGPGGYGSVGLPGGYIQSTLNLDPTTNYQVQVGQFGYVNASSVLQGGGETKVSNAALTVAAGGGASGGDPYNYPGGPGSMRMTEANAPAHFAPEDQDKLAGIGLFTAASPSPSSSPIRQSGDGYAIAYWGSSIFKTWVQGTELHLVGFNLASNLPSSTYTVTGVSVAKLGGTNQTCTSPPSRVGSNSEYWTCTLPTGAGAGAISDSDQYYGEVTLTRSLPAPSRTVTLPFSGPGISSLGVGADPGFLVDSRYARSKTMDRNQFYPLPAGGCSTVQRTWLDLVSEPPGRQFNLTGFSSCDINGWRENGGELAFNGTSDYVTTTGFYQNAVTAYTVEAWIYSTAGDSDNPRVIFSNRTSSDTNYTSLTFYLYGNKLMFAVDYPGVRIGVKTPVPSLRAQWHHVVGTWQASSGTRVAKSQFQIYLDGKKMTTDDEDIGSTYRTSPLSGDPSGAKIGWNVDPDLKFKGSMSRVAVYNRVLSENEIYEHCTRLASRYGCSR